MNTPPTFPRRIPFVIVVVLFLIAKTAPHVLAGEAELRLGKELFEHRWLPNDKLSPGGDGLGPMHNAVSCVACHHLGGTGGAGAADHNVELLSVVAATRNPTEAEKDKIQARSKEIHPAFFGSNAGSSVLLHLFSTEAPYERWRLLTLGFDLPADLDPTKYAIAMRSIQRKRSRQPPVAELPRSHGVSLRLSERNTTALFGAGLIDTVTKETLQELATQQAKQFPGIHGRVPSGRFGWRGHVSTLREFVLTACAMELGLQSANHPQAVNPLAPSVGRGDPRPGDDLTELQCDALVAFVASFPAPTQLRPANQQQANQLNNGEKLFDSIGCAGCHVRDVGNVRGIFSDLLLHDMGTALEDPLPAIPEGGATKVFKGNGGGSYGGGCARPRLDGGLSLK